MKPDGMDFLSKQIPVEGNWSVMLILTIFIFIGALFLRQPIYFIVCKILKKLTHTKPWGTALLKSVEQPLQLIISTVVWLAFLNILPVIWHPSGRITLLIISGIIFVIKGIIGFGLVWLTYNVTDHLVGWLIERVSDVQKDSSLRTHFKPFVIRFVKIAVAGFGGLLVLQNLGVNVMSLMAGLGLGGVALALAAKDSASNILAYLNIMLDKPFSIGDWVYFNEIEGNVVDVGFRSCKIKTFYDSVISVPNSVVAAAHIDNMKKRKARRIRTYLGVQYNTSPHQLTQFIAGIEQILKNNSYVRHDYFQVYFTEFGASELKIIVNFFLTVSTWEAELKQKQNIFMEILKLSEKLNVSFAFPTQTLHVESLPQPSQPSQAPSNIPPSSNTPPSSK